MNIKVVVLLLGIINLSSIYAEDFSLDEYNLTMAKEELRTGNLRKAEQLLGEVGPGPEKQKLIKAMQEARHHQQIAAKEKKRKKEEAEKEKRILAEQKKLEERQIIESARPELLRRTLCDCNQLKIKFEASIIQEKAAAQYSGVVNKQKLYEAGQALHTVDLKLSKIRNEMNEKKVMEKNCDSYQDEQGYICYSF